LHFAGLACRANSDRQRANFSGAGRAAIRGAWRSEIARRRCDQDFRLGYRTLGSLNAGKSNAILWPSWLGGKSEDLLRFLGPGKVVDTTNYFVVLVDAVGNGVSSSPSNSSKQPLMKFPVFTIRDMVEAERRLLVEVLHISHLHAVMGISMGGMQTFEWAVAYPNFMDLAIPMMGSPQSTSFDKLVWTAQIDAIELDPAWNHGHPTGPLAHGFAVSEEIDQMNLTSPAYRVAHTSPKDFEVFLAHLKKHAAGDGGTASNQIRQREAIISLDIPGELGLTLAESANKVRAKMLVIVSPQEGESDSGARVCGRDCGAHRDSGFALRTHQP
jgi:homoserine O-acetyltransferase